MSWARAFSELIDNVCAIFIVMLTFGFVALFFGWPILFLAWILWLVAR